MSSDVVILFGGSSSERLVSVASAQNVSSLLSDAALWFLTRAGAVHVVSRAQLGAHQRPFENEFTPGTPAVFPSIGAALDARGSKALVDDVLAYASHLRRVARELPIIQTTESLVEDDNDRRTTDPFDGKRLDPKTCELR